jgi:DNA-binding transcriptional LysR family regulator
MFDWNDLRFFLELQRSGRLLTAARRLNTTHATVARHIEAIEKASAPRCSSSMPRATS